jgi:ribonuclease HI
MKDVIIYTDGACSGNPGPGGWGAVLMYGTHVTELSGFDEQTTNNRMEMTAAIRALEKLNQPCCVSLYSDSAYLVNAFEKGWLDNWQANDWKTAAKNPVENQDLWQRLISLAKTHDITWIKVKGHADNEHNNRCDMLATGEIKKHRQAVDEKDGSVDD